MDIKTQLPALKQGVEILVATPGRLLDHVEQKSVQLNQVQMLVLDEADRMLDMGFMPDLKRILALLPKQRQTLMFSATFSNEIKKLADDFLKNPTLIEVARSNATNDNVEQILYTVDSHEKQMLLVQLLQEDSIRQVIVFTKTKLAASRLSRALQKQSINADAIHGDKSQKERLEALEAFKAGKTQALVATDVAARGLDINELPMVINYEIPTSPEDYVHRIGRTGRAGAKGIAISLMSPEEEKYWVEIEKLIKISVSKQVKTPALEGKRDAAPKASSTKPATHRKGPKHDSWFDKPYEPMPNTMPNKPVINANASKKPVAALLGGLAFKRNPQSKR
jgi:superfamily II DNA/RNA helicase